MGKMGAKAVMCWGMCSAQGTRAGPPALARCQTPRLLQSLHTLLLSFLAFRTRAQPQTSAMPACLEIKAISCLMELHCLYQSSCAAATRPSIVQHGLSMNELFAASTADCALLLQPSTAMPASGRGAVHAATNVTPSSPWCGAALPTFQGSLVQLTQ